jgi:hypothetical protein
MHKAEAGNTAASLSEIYRFKSLPTDWPLRHFSQLSSASPNKVRDSTSKN